MRGVIVLLLLVVSMSSPLREAGASSIVGTRLSTVATQAGSAAVVESDLPGATPYSRTTTVDLGDTSSESVYFFTDDRFEISASHVRGPDGVPAQGGDDAKSTGLILFKPDSDVMFQASGSYTAADSQGLNIVLLASLFDYTTNATVFGSYQRSIASPNESFTLGLAEGDERNVVDGSLSGALVADHEYGFTYSMLLSAYPYPVNSGATATGNISLDFSTPIPEPGTGMLMGAGLVALAARGRRSSC